MRCSQPALTMVNYELYKASNSSRRSSVFRMRVRTRVDCALLAVLLVPGPIWAQNGGSGNQETISQLVEQIKQLQQEDRNLQADRDFRAQASSTPACTRTRSRDSRHTPAVCGTDRVRFGASANIRLAQPARHTVARLRRGELQSARSAPPGAGN